MINDDACRAALQPHHCGQPVNITNPFPLERQPSIPDDSLSRWIFASLCEYLYAHAEGGLSAFSHDKRGQQ